jgi:putative peptide zinc metalloprotease protein
MNAAPPVVDGHWYRVAELRPRLQAGVTVQRQPVRMRDWFILSHPVTGRHYRLSRSAYEFIGRLDGRRSVDAVWQELRESQGDEAPTQGEALTLMARLTQAGILVADRLPDVRVLREAQAQRDRQERRSALNPLSFRLRLMDPSRWLERLDGVARAGRGEAWIFAWLALIAAALGVAVMEWQSISAFAARYWLTPRCFLLTWIAYPFLKGLHELGHGLVIRRFGGQVREAGISLFLLLPAPYVDASAATAMPSKWQRALVGAAGIMVELALASVALLVWLYTEPGLLNDFAFTVALVGSLSTLVFNGNPLLRFDGYHVMTDVFELPNLANRSRRYVSARLQRLLFGRAPAPEEDGPLSRRERLWLAGYAPASAVYRIFICIAIVSWIASKSAAVGLGVALWLAYAMAVRPLVQGLRSMAGSGNRWRAAIIVAVCATLLFGIPLPDRTIAPAVLWLPEHAHIRTATEGRVAEVMVRDGEAVKRGQALIRIENAALLVQAQRIEALVRAAQSEQIGAWQWDPARARNAAVDLERLGRDLAEVHRQLESLTLRAAVDGVVAMPHPQEWVGRDVQRGVTVARVLARDFVTARVVVAQDDIGRVRDGVQGVRVRMAGAEEHSYAGEWVRATPAATHRLPSLALSDRWGGRYVTDPADPEGLKTLEPVFVLDVQVPLPSVASRAGAAADPALSYDRAGARAWVALEHPARPLAAQWTRRLRQTFLRHFWADN